MYCIFYFFLFKDAHKITIKCKQQAAGVQRNTVNRVIAFNVNTTIQQYLHIRLKKTGMLI